MHVWVHKVGDHIIAHNSFISQWEYLAIQKNRMTRFLLLRSKAE